MLCALLLYEITLFTKGKKPSKESYIKLYKMILNALNVKNPEFNIYKSKTNVNKIFPLDIDNRKPYSMLMIFEDFNE